MAYTDLVPRSAPGDVNTGLSPLAQSTCRRLLGNPRTSYTTSCQPVTSKALLSRIVTQDVGPFLLLDGRGVIDDGIIGVVAGQRHVARHDRVLELLAAIRREATERLLHVAKGIVVIGFETPIFAVLRAREAGGPCQRVSSDLLHEALPASRRRCNSVIAVCSTSSSKPSEPPPFLSTHER